MTLPTTPGANLSMNQVNVELGFGGSTSISLQDTAVRSLFEKTTVSSAISFSDGSNKTNIKYTGISGYTAVANNDTYYGPWCGTGQTGYSHFNYHANGQIDIAAGSFGADPFNRWGVVGITGGNFYIRFTRTGLSPGFSGSATSSTGWLQLNTARLVGVSAGGFDAGGDAVYTIEISNNASGATILNTRTGISFNVFNECGGG